MKLPAFTLSIRWPDQGLSLDDFVSQYRKLYQDGIDLFAEFDPCRIHDGLCMRGRRDHGLESSNFCCSGCEYLTSEGCTTDSIWCKLWTCGATKSDQVFGRKRQELNSMANDLCRGNGGRYGLDVFIKRFFGEEEYDKWSAKEMKPKSNSISLSSGK